MLCILSKGWLATVSFACGFQWLVFSSYSFYIQGILIFIILTNFVVSSNFVFLYSYLAIWKFHTICCLMLAAKNVMLSSYHMLLIRRYINNYSSCFIMSHGLFRCYISVLSVTEKAVVTEVFDTLKKWNLWEANSIWTISELSLRFVFKELSFMTSVSNLWSLMSIWSRDISGRIFLFSLAFHINNILKLFFTQLYALFLAMAVRYFSVK